MDLTRTRRGLPGAVIARWCAGIDVGCCDAASGSGLPESGPECPGLGVTMPTTLMVTLSNPTPPNPFRGGLLKCIPAITGITDTPTNRTNVAGVTTSFNARYGTVSQIDGFDAGSYECRYIGVGTGATGHLWVASRSPVAGGWTREKLGTLTGLDGGYGDYATRSPLASGLFRDPDGTYRFNGIGSSFLELASVENISGVASWCAERVCGFAVPCDIDVLTVGAGSVYWFSPNYIANILGYQNYRLGGFTDWTYATGGSPDPCFVTIPVTTSQQYSVWRNIFITIEDDGICDHANVDCVTYVMWESTYDEEPNRTTPPGGYAWLNALAESHYKRVQTFTESAVVPLAAVGMHVTGQSDSSPGIYYNIQIDG